MIKNRYLIVALILIVAIFTFFTSHQIINSDSVSGFTALNGYDWTGKFNTNLYYDEASQKLGEKFLTWWSPGQYLVPWILIKTLFINLGTAVTMVNFLCTVLGAIGYFLVFKRYRFSPTAIIISVSLILFSGTILPRYYSYQGGESLNFLIFPWIILSQDWFFKKPFNFILPGLFLLLSFIFKLQLLIIVPPLIFILIANKQGETNFLFDREKRWRIQDIKFRKIIFSFIPFLFSLSVAFSLIFIFFLSKGVTPAAATNNFSFNPLNLLVPVASPVTSVYFFETGFDFLNSHVFLQKIYLCALSAIIIFLLVYLIKKSSDENLDKKKYLLMFLSLYSFSVLIFFILYSRGNIDYSPRHFKLTSFLLYPIVIDWLLGRNFKKLVYGMAVFFILFGIINHVRLSRTWLSGTSVTRSGFRLSKEDMPLKLKEELDNRVKTKTIVISRFEERYAIDNNLILPIESKDPYSVNTKNLGYPVLILDSLSGKKAL